MKSVLTNQWLIPDDSARQSFPSGHSSTAMAGMLFLSLFLNQQIPVLLPK